MAGNSRAYILNEMKKGAILNDWAAISIMNRTRLNRILFQQWVANNDGSRYMPPINGRAYTTEQKTEYVDLQDIVLGPPVLSFETASFTDSVATLTLPIISGTCTAFAIASALTSVLYNYTIREEHGFTVTVKVDLAVMTGEVDNLGRVFFDLSRGTNIECNLAGAKPARVALGNYFQQRFDELPPHRRVFVLGMFNRNGNNPMTPKRFEVRTQAAPGGNDVMSSTYRDGAVVIFIQVRASEFGGGMPASIIYLLPDDQGPQGDKYSAALFISEKYADATDDQLALMQSLLFPEDRSVFQELDRDKPLELAIFGNIDPSRTAMTIEPAMHSLQAGSKPFQYRALRDGKAVSASWSVRSLNTHESVGEIGPATGLYTPVASDQAGKETVRNVVTATYTDPSTGVIHNVSASLLVTAEPMAISPSVVPCLLRGGQQPITFVASTLGNAELSWSPPLHGSLVANGSTAIYTPPEKPLAQDVVVQIIEAKNTTTGESVNASVVLLKFVQDFNITPGFTQGLNRSATVQLKEHDRKPELKRRWSVLGEGTVSPSGLYTGPSVFRDPNAVVVCELLDSNGEVDSYGYSIVQLTKAITEPTWKNLSKFNISKVVGKAYANGMQQQVVRIEVETAAVNGKVHPLTGDEEATLRLVDRADRGEIPFINKGQDGIEFGSKTRWATNWQQNRFRVTAQTQVIAPEQSSPGNDLLVTDKLIYVHCRGANPTDTPSIARYVASFIGDGDKGQFYSDKHPGENNTEDQGLITLTPVAIPVKVRGDYIFSGKRVAGGGAGGEGRPTGPGWPPLPEGEDDFEYFLDTICYWLVRYEREKVPRCCLLDAILKIINLF
ncbi:hypothetical protein IMF27_04270 [Pseudomonas sp. PCH199]|uniref:hypothetical protein n=1 Tax=unclassified Pseudomonas TaxID=196821 RepID=UPI000BD7E489|nr:MULTISPECIES: hypothetical protein [unclassified Pseudomonas]MCW8275012.1 hypothetical protein [Pseudomonas sp. PCH199]PAM84689.1 hypothetical protein CES87_04360 [Pseudomonas sp. ERMR1:02]